MVLWLFYLKRFRYHHYSRNVITGVSNWATHSNGPISGTIIGDSLSFTITYPEGAIGYYYAPITENAMVNCLAQSSTGDTVSWETAWIACTSE
jgi:hypothetical protein